MNIIFYCPHCIQKIEAPAEYSGSEIICPTCQKTLICPEQENVQPKKGSPSMKEIFKNAGKFYWQSCPHCNEFVKIEQYLDGYEVSCPKCKQDFIAQNQNKNQCQVEYKFQIFEFDEIPQGLSALAADGWEVVSQSTIFLSEGSAGLLGISGGTRTEGIGYTLKRFKN